MRSLSWLYIYIFLFYFLCATVITHACKYRKMKYEKKKEKDNKLYKKFRLHRPGRGVWWGDGGATAMHCPAIKQLPRGQTGDW